MRYYSKFLFILIFLITIKSLYADKIIFSPLQMDNPEKEFAKWSQVINLLTKYSGYNIKYKYYQDRSELVEKLSKNEIAITYLCPLTYVFAKNNNRLLEPLFAINVKEGAYKYRCVMFTTKDRDIKTNQLKGKKYALVNPLATCGFLSANIIYKKYTNLDLNEGDFSYLGTHENTIESVISGKYDIGVTNNLIYAKYADLFNLKIIDEISDLPGFVIAVDKRYFDKNEINKIKDSLLKVFSHESVKKFFPFGLSEISDKNYDVIRNMLNKTEIPGLIMK